MARINYVHEGGSPLRWIVGLFLAVGLVVLLVAGGRLGAEQLCGGACGPLEPLGEFLRQPFIVMSDHLNWCMGLAIGFGVLLWVALGGRQNGLAFILILALLLLGAAMAGVQKQKDVEEIIEVEEPVEPEVVTSVVDRPRNMTPDRIVIDTSPEPEPLPEEPVNQCPAGNFWNGEGCSTCSITQIVPVAAQISLTPVSLGASWDYADARHIRLGEDAPELSVRELPADDRIPCESDAILVLGSASSDGPLGRNLNRARARAEQLAEQVKRSCETAPTVFALSLGQSTAERDNFKDRALTVIGLDSVDGTEVTQAMVEQELGYALGDPAVPASLFSRAGYFPQDNWSWVEGGEGKVQVIPGPRPTEAVDQLRVGAPASCE